MKKIIFTLFIFSTIATFPAKTLAVCPICTVAVGAGLGISRYIGIDDSVVGVWIGGLIVSMGLWLSSFLQKKNIKIPRVDLISVIFMALLTIIPLYFSKLIGHPSNKLWGIDKILLGSAFGAVAFILSVKADQYLRQKNNGKVLIYYQKVILPVLFLTLTSFFFYLAT